MNYKNRIDAQDRIINDPNINNVAIKDAAKKEKASIQLRIRGEENNISVEKRKRQNEYADRLDPAKIDPATGKLVRRPLYMRGARSILTRGAITRGAELGAAQINIKNTEAEIEQLKNTLTEKKKEQDVLKNDIKRIDEQERQGRFNPLDPNDPQVKQRDKLKIELYELLNGKGGANPPGIIQIGKDIREMELNVKRLKNLS